MENTLQNNNLENKIFMSSKTTTKLTSSQKIESPQLQIHNLICKIFQVTLNEVIFILFIFFYKI